MVGEYSDKELETILNKVLKWGRDFSKSNNFQKLTKEQKDNSRFIIESFSDCMYSYHEIKQKIEKSTQLTSSSEYS